MNDYIAGYLGGAGHHRGAAAAGGGGRQLPRPRQPGARGDVVREPRDFPSIDFVPGEENRMIAPETITFASAYGEVHRLAPMAKLSKTPGRWQSRSLTVRGSDRAGLEGRAVTARWLAPAIAAAGAGRRAGRPGAGRRDPERSDEGQYPLLLDGTFTRRRRPQGGRGAAFRALPVSDGHGALGCVQGGCAGEDRHHLRRVVGGALPELFRRAAVQSAAPSGTRSGRSSR